MTAASSDPQQDRLLLSAELRDQVAAAMERLSGNERTAFVLRHFEGMPVEEIGKTLGIQANAAKVRVLTSIVQSWKASNSGQAVRSSQ